MADMTKSVPLPHIERVRSLMGLPEYVEALNVLPDEGTDYWHVSANLGWADVVIADMLVERDTALALALSLEPAYGCGVYDENGERQ